MDQFLDIISFFHKCFGIKGSVTKLKSQYKDSKADYLEIIGTIKGYCPREFDDVQSDITNSSSGTPTYVFFIISDDSGQLYNVVIDIYKTIDKDELVYKQYLYLEKEIGKEIRLRVKKFSGDGFYYLEQLNLS